jgi:hypothetical protein
MVKSPAGPGTKNDCADEAQQQFTRPTGSIQFQLVGWPMNWKGTNCDVHDVLSHHLY